MARSEIEDEAFKRYPPNHMVDDPFGATGYAESDPYGYDDTARAAFIAGAEWERERIRAIVQKIRDSAASQLYPGSATGTAIRDFALGEYDVLLTGVLKAD